MGNRNLFMADAVQVARHYGISLVYSVILSSWIDPRLKQLTDLLIYCTDHAMSAEAEEHGVKRVSGATGLSRPVRPVIG